MQRKKLLLAWHDIGQYIIFPFIFLTIIQYLMLSRQARWTAAMAKKKKILDNQPCIEKYILSKHGIITRRTIKVPKQGILPMGRMGRKWA